MKPPLLIILTLVFLSINFAQAATFEDASANLPPGLAGACMDVAAGDADGDGDLDLVMAMEFERNRLLLNDGAGRFVDATSFLPDLVHDSEDVSFVDVDGDGDLDLFFVSEDDRTDELYLNDGNGVFSDANDRLEVNQVANAHAVLDLDSDGDMDLLFGNVGTNVVLLNNGDGTFVDATAARWPQAAESRTQDLELFDADGDRDMDLAVANEGQNQLFLNNDGVFTEVTASALPGRDDESREMRAVDVDGDGDLDLAVANVAFLTPGPADDYLLLNDGTGRFVLSTATYPEDSRSNFTVQAVDIDRDGDMDMLLPATLFSTNQQSMFLMASDAEGVRQIYQVGPFGLDDTDGDGDRDIFTRIDGQRVTFTNEGGIFTLANPDESGLSPVAPDRLDFDGDGNNDLAIWNATIALQDQGGAIFSESNIEFYDVDDDGSVEALGLGQFKMDAVGDTLVLINDGSGNFTRAAPDAWFPAAANGNGFDIEVADFDNDGLMDMFFCNRASAVDYPAASGGTARLLRGINN